jgi:hypothetical protein
VRHRALHRRGIRYLSQSYVLRFSRRLWLLSTWNDGSTRSRDKLRNRHGMIPCSAFNSVMVDAASLQHARRPHCRRFCALRSRNILVAFCFIRPNIAPLDGDMHTLFVKKLHHSDQQHWLELKET